MDGSVHRLILWFHVVLLFVVGFVAEVAGEIRVDVGLGRDVSRFHVTVDLVDAHLQHVHVGGEVFLLVGHCRQGAYLQYLVDFKRILFEH